MFLRAFAIFEAHFDGSLCLRRPREGCGVDIGVVKQSLNLLTMHVEFVRNVLATC